MSSWYWYKFYEVCTISVLSFVDDLGMMRIA
jgi:hypothetical protein